MRWLGLFCLGAVACGPGAGAPDAGPPPTREGVWRLGKVDTTITGVTTTINDVDTPLAAMGGTHDFRVNGTLTVTEDVLAVASINVLDDHLGLTPVETWRGPLVLSSSYVVDTPGVFRLSNQTPAEVPFTFDPSTDRLVLRPSAEVALTYARAAFARTETFPVRVTVAQANEASVFASLHVGVVFLTRAGFVHSPGDDQPIQALPQDFTFDRTAGALGTQRIPFGILAGISVGLIVVYQERDSAPGLGKLYNASNCTGADDCVRGVSPIVLAYRDGDSPELAASAYAYLVPGWAPALPVNDTRNPTARPGLVSLDPSTEALPFDVVVPDNAADVVVPALVF